MKIKLKEGQTLVDIEGNKYLSEYDDYILDKSDLYDVILGDNILDFILGEDKRQEIDVVIAKYGKVFVIEQLLAGVQIELEHTDDIQQSLNIAVDHITEIPDYYSRLIKMEADADDDGMLLHESMTYIKAAVALKDIGISEYDINEIMRLFSKHTQTKDLEVALFNSMKKDLIKDSLSDKQIDYILHMFNSF